MIVYWVRRCCDDDSEWSFYCGMYVDGIGDFYFVYYIIEDGYDDDIIICI